jgi:methionyl-tRNA formyltransferase
MKKRVVVLGKGELAGNVAKWFLDNPAYELFCVVPNNPAVSWTLRLEDWARDHKVPVVDSGRTSDVPPGVIDLAVSVTYDKIIKPDFIARCKRIINIHNSPLPKYRGVNPINWALKNSETQHGVTIHEITPGIDDGPIVSQILFPVDPDKDEVADVYKRCMEKGWKLFEKTMRDFWQTPVVEQDHSKASHYTKKDFDKLGERRNFTRKESLPKQDEKKVRVGIDTTFMDGRAAKGTAIFIRELLEGLKSYKDELDITLIHRESVPQDPLYVAYKEVVIPKVPLPRGSGPVSELLYFLCSRRSTYDVYYFAYSKLPPYFFLAPGKRLVSMQYDGGPDTAGFDLPDTQGKISNWMLPLMNRFVDAFVATSEFGRKGLVEKRGLPASKVHVAYGGASNLFTRTPIEEAWKCLEEQYAITRQPYIIASGRLDPHKNILRIIDAYDILRRKYGILHKMIITGGAHMPEYTEKVFAHIRELQLEKDVLVLRVREFSEMPHFYSAADVMVFPSLYEGFGLPLVEAMKCGVATVAAKGSSLTEVGGDATEFVDPLSSEDIARGIYKVLSNLEYRESLVRKGYDQAKKFTWEIHARSVVEIFKRVA